MNKTTKSPAKKTSESSLKKTRSTDQARAKNKAKAGTKTSRKKTGGESEDSIVPLLPGYPELL